MKKFVKVVLNLNIFSEFVYEVPDIFSFSLKFKRVYVPFKKKIKIGFVVDEFLGKNEDFNFNIEKVIDVIDYYNLISEKELKFYKWLSDYYITPLGQIIFNALPPVNIESLKLKIKDENYLGLNENEQKILNLLRDGYSLKKIQAEISYFFVYLKSLIDNGIIEIKKKQYRISKKDYLSVLAEISYQYFRPEKLNQHQEKVWNSLKDRLNNFTVNLLFGITGSGKTEIYLKAIKEVLNKNKQIIYLVPEIALTPGLLEVFFENFKDKKIAVIHSKITSNKRNKILTEIANNNIDIVIGARSAIFAPLKKLGLIIVDEEHEQSYKQEDKPRYNARDSAIVKAKIYNCPIILGSATPSLKSWYNAKKGKYFYYEIKNRVNNNPLPEVELIDLKEEKNDKIISEKLKQEILNEIKKKGQVILFLNKKGYASFLFCSSCGYVFKCKNCEISLTYYKSKNSLFCPYCENNYKVDYVCPKCNSPYLRMAGKGTEKIEEKIIHELEGVKVARFDLESTQKKGELEKILKDFNEGEIDIIVGTQMIAKGHDFKNVGLVGVITIDNVLNFPDYTSSERAFQLLVQCSGRAGRGKNKGKVIVQTYNIENYIFQFFKNYDFEGFYEKELEFRKLAKYPPFYNLAHIILEGNTENKVQKNIKKLFEKINQSDIIKIGPSKSPIFKIRNKYRYSILLKSKSKARLNSCVRNLLNEKLDSGVDFKIDIDPENIA